MHTIWSGRGHQRQRRGKNKKKHAPHLVWPCMPKGQNFKERQKKSHMPYGPAVAVISKKKEKQTLSYTPSELALISNGPKFNGKTKNCRHAIWSGRDWHWAKKDEKQKMSRMLSSLAGAVISKKNWKN
jgi:hypothetical protein